MQVTKSHQLQLLMSLTGCCACCSVVAVICVCKLVYQDYAATFTGVGIQQMSDLCKQMHCVFIRSMLEFDSDQIASQDKSFRLFQRAIVSLKERRIGLVLVLTQGSLKVKKKFSW